MTVRRTPRPGALLAALAAVVLPLLLAGCSGFQGTGDANFVVGNSSVVQIDEADRGEPVEASGDSLEGDPVDLTAYRGDVVVLNFWGSWCNPCRDEAPVLAEASEQLDAVFVGAQLRDDSTAAAIAFEREFGITYPTIADSGATMLALGRYSPTGSPSTAVLDPQGRVAALVNGPLTSVRTLEDLVDDARAAGGGAAS